MLDGVDGGFEGGAVGSEVEGGDDDVFARALGGVGDALGELLGLGCLLGGGGFGVFFELLGVLAQDLTDCVLPDGGDFGAVHGGGEVGVGLFEGCGVEGGEGFGFGLEVVGLGVCVEGGVVGEGGDSSDALGDAFLGDEGAFDGGGGGGEVGAAAELDGGGAPCVVFGVAQELIDLDPDGDDADGVGVGFVEDGAEAGDGLCGFEGSGSGVDGEVLVDGVVDDGLGLGELFVGDGLAVGEVEAEFFVGDEGAALVHVGADGFSECEVEEVGGGVVGGDSFAAFGGDGAGDGGSGAEFAFGDASGVDDVASEGLDVFDFEDGACFGAADFSGVGDLAAHFGVEVGFVEDDGDGFEGGVGSGGVVVEVVAVPDGFDGGVDVVGGELGAVVGWFDVEVLELGDLFGAEVEADAVGGFAA